MLSLSDCAVKRLKGRKSPFLLLKRDVHYPSCIFLSLCLFVLYFRISILCLFIAWHLHVLFIFRNDVQRFSWDVERLINDNAIRLSLSLSLLRIVRYYITI